MVARRIEYLYQSRIDPELCSNCGICLERCPIDAISEMEGAPEVNSEKCIGCGVCVAACPVKAIALSEVPGAKPPFRDHQEMRAKVCRERGLA